MFKRLLIFALMITLSNVANSAVVFDWTGGGGTTDWDTAANWSATGATTWTQPSEQYSGVPSAVITNAPADGPNYAYINSDITAININGATVDKTAEVPPTTSSYLVLGGNNATVTLDNAATLTIGQRLWIAEDIAGAGGVVSQINVLNGSTVNVGLYHIGHGGAGIVNVTGGSTWNCSSQWGRMATYANGNATMNVEDSTFYTHQSLHVGEAENTTAALNLTNSTATVGTRLRVGVGNNGTATTDLANTKLSIGGYLGVGGGTNSTGALTITDGSEVGVGQYTWIGYPGATGIVSLSDSKLDTTSYTTIGDANGTGTMNVVNSTVTTGTYLYVGGSQFVAGTGTLNLDNSTFTVGTAVRLARAECVTDGETGEKIPGTGGQGTINVANGSTLNVGTQLRIGYGGDGTLNVTGGSTLNHGGDVRVSYVAGSRGWLNVTDSTFSSANYLYVGYADSTTGHAVFDNSTVDVGVTDNARLTIGQSNSTGTVDVLNGSVVTVGDDIVLGGGSAGNGTLNIDASSVTVLNDDIYVADGGTAVVNVSNGGSFGTNGDAFMIGLVDPNSTGTVNAVSGSLLHSAGRTYIGYSGGTGTMNLTDATLDVGTDLRLGHNVGATGILNLSGNSVVNVGRDFETSANAGEIKNPGDSGLVSLIHVYDGEVNINGYCSLGTSGQGGSYTEFVLDAGIVNIGLNPPEYAPETFDPPVAGNKIGDLILGWRDYDAEAYLTINGGTMTVAGAIRFGSETHWTTEDPENPGTYIPVPHTGTGEGRLQIAINGGVLQGEDLVYTGNIPDSLLTLTGGQLRIRGSAVSEADMLALIAGGDIACPDGYFIYSDGDYTVLTIPEPTGMLLILLGLGTVLLIRRNR